MGNLFTTFTNCRLCINGQIVEGERLVVSQDNGLILKSTGYIGGEIVDLDDQIIAPGFLDLHTNGVKGFHFTAFDNESQYRAKLEETAQYYVSQGVTAFWATIPTVESDLYQKVCEPCFESDQVFFRRLFCLMPYLSKSYTSIENDTLNPISSSNQYITFTLEDSIYQVPVSVSTYQVSYQTLHIRFLHIRFYTSDSPYQTSSIKHFHQKPSTRPPLSLPQPKLIS